MIHVFIGTKAQLIKMAPVMVELQRRDIPYNFIFSGQHQATVSNIREEFGLKKPDVTLYEGRDITGIVQMLFWSLRIIFYVLTHRQEVWRGDSGGIVLNHGDTFSTLLGSFLARICGQRSAPGGSNPVTHLPPVQYILCARALGTGESGEVPRHQGGYRA
jgi:UDP-N-acetylglucosamine 2-epimerase (non-hydrolysing)